MVRRGWCISSRTNVRVTVFGTGRAVLVYILVFSLNLDDIDYGKNGLVLGCISTSRRCCSTTLHVEKFTMIGKTA